MCTNAESFRNTYQNLVLFLLLGGDHVDDVPVVLDVGLLFGHPMSKNVVIEFFAELKLDVGAELIAAPGLLVLLEPLQRNMCLPIA